MGQIITFYSYKGGVGRSMALANVAVILSKWGFKTLLIDWDLEAPGLENFFHEYVEVAKIEKKKGVLEYLTATQKSGPEVDWQQYITPILTPVGKEPIHFMPAGKRDADYFKRVREFDVSKFYEEHEGGKILERLRHDLKEKYDFVLVDSRTGVTDVGGICTIQMPDILVLLFTPTEQGLRGIRFIADSARKGQQSLPARKRLLVFPVPTRIDSSTEFKISKEWTERFAKELAAYYNDWLPADVEKHRFIEHIKLPYISYFSYGEKLPFIEQGTDDKGGLGFAYENIAALLASGLEDSLHFMEDRDEYVRRFSKNEGSGPVARVEKNEPPIQVFISYAPKDRDKIERLTRGITSSSWKVQYKFHFWEPAEILAGENIQIATQQAIQNADVFLVGLSNSYLPENENLWELQFASSTVSAGAASPIIVPIYLQTLQARAIEANPLKGTKGLPTSGEGCFERGVNERETLSGLRRVFAHIRAQKEKGSKN